MKKYFYYRVKVMRVSLNKIVKILCKIFFIGLLFQFFIQTFFTYKLWFSGSFRNCIWMRKEFILLCFWGLILRSVIKELPKYLESFKKIKKEGKNPTVSRFLSLFVQHSFSSFMILLIVTSLVFCWIAFLCQHTPIKNFLLSFKYDLIPLYIFGIWIGISYFFFSEKDQDVIEFYRKIIEWSLIVSFWWWFILLICPKFFKYFWFDVFNYEGTVWMAPPVAYYTKISPNVQDSFVRNSFLFERPTTFWFWLIGFFPFYILSFLRTKARKNQIFFALCFWLLIFSTLSRAALVIRVIECLMLVIILYWNKAKKYGIRMIIGIVTLMMGIGYVWRNFFVREHSNTGHLVLALEWWELAKKKIITWWWVGYAGPASHQICHRDIIRDEFWQDEKHIVNEDDERCETIRQINENHQIQTVGYNPENQYLQILIEYGVVWTVFWLWCIARMFLYAIKMRRKFQKVSKNKYQQGLFYGIIGLTIGLFWICVEGLVLHSLMDRMVVYPFFLLYGIMIGLWKKEKKNLIVTKNQKK